MMMTEEKVTHWNAPNCHVAGFPVGGKYQVSSLSLVITGIQTTTICKVRTPEDSATARTEDSQQHLQKVQELLGPNVAVKVTTLKAYLQARNATRTGTRAALLVRIFNLPDLDPNDQVVIIIDDGEGDNDENGVEDDIGWRSLKWKIIFQ